MWGAVSNRWAGSRSLCRLGLGLLVAAQVGVARPAVAAEPLVISTLPFDDAAAQEAVFGILSRHLARALGRPVEFRAGRSYDEVIEGLAQGKVDVGFVGAAAYVQARRSGNVRAILRTLRHGNTKYRGVIIARAGGDVRAVGDLAGKRFAFVDKSSGAGYLLPSLLLRKAGIDPVRGVQPLFAGGHHDVVKMVARGEADAGACFDGAHQSAADPAAVVVIARTEAIPTDPVVVRAGLGPELVSALRGALIDLSSVADARPFFTYAEIDGFVPAYDRDYDAVATMLREAGG